MAAGWTTLVLQTVNFLVLAWLLQRFLYRPVLAAIDRRRAETVATQTKAAEAEAASRRAEQEWRDKNMALEAERLEVLRRAEADGQRRAAELIAEAHRQAESLLVEGRRVLAAERAQAAADLGDHAAGVAVTLAQRLLTIVAPGIGAEPFLALLPQGMPGSLTLAVMPPLPQDRHQHWRNRFGGAVTITTAPELIAGARLSSPDTVAEVSWAAALAQALTEISDAQSG
jgi:F-type H+-transporting ATPase subunit b